jgi:hypothetical protein
MQCTAAAEVVYALPLGSAAPRPACLESQMSKNTALVVASVVAGVVLIALAFVYWI